MEMNQNKKDNNKLTEEKENGLKSTLRCWKF